MPFENIKIGNKTYSLEYVAYTNSIDLYDIEWSYGEDEEDEWHKLENSKEFDFIYDQLEAEMKKRLGMGFSLFEDLADALRPY
jgi:hypothetical protein